MAPIEDTRLVSEVDWHDFSVVDFAGDTGPCGTSRMPLIASCQHVWRKGDLFFLCANAGNPLGIAFEDRNARPEGGERLGDSPTDDRSTACNNGNPFVEKHALWIHVNSVCRSRLARNRIHHCLGKEASPEINIA